jgi:hypothetical protein
VRGAHSRERAGEARWRGVACCSVGVDAVAPPPRASSVLLSLQVAGLAVNKNTVPGDKSALVPSGIRMGSPALTSRGLDEADFERVVSRVSWAACDVKSTRGRVSAVQTVPAHPATTCAAPTRSPANFHPPQASFFHRAVEVTKAHKAACDAKGLKKVAEFRNRCGRRVMS